MLDGTIKYKNKYTKIYIFQKNTVNIMYVKIICQDVKYVNWSTTVQ